MGLAYEIHREELRLKKEREAALADGSFVSDRNERGPSVIVGELPSTPPDRGGAAALEYREGKIEVEVFESCILEGTLYSPGTYNVTIGRALRLFEMGKAKEAKELRWNFWDAPGRILAAEPCDARPHSMEPTDGALCIVAGCDYDPGNAAFRQHTLTNEHTKHASTFIRFFHTNPFCDIRQLDGETQLHEARSAVYNADVIHSHVGYVVQARTGYKFRRPLEAGRPKQLVIRHYHGTVQTGKQWPIVCMMEDDLCGAVLVGARLTLCDVRPRFMRWLPIAVPVRRLHAMVPKERRPGPFRIAHSPSKRELKGTTQLIDAVSWLQRKGLKVELQLIEKQQYGDALRMKTDADATFDSFWLGLQGSGLEAAAMGQMVIAGDPSAKALYETMKDPDGNTYVGYCPYTFADSAKDLVAVIERAITDVEWYKSEVKRVAKYVMEFHDYASVARRYEAILAQHMGPIVLTPPKKKRAR